MPIRPENVDRYPKDWPEISRCVKERARWRCEACGVAHGALGGRRDSGGYGDGTFVPAAPIGERLGGREWPKPGALARCIDGRTRRIIRIVLTVAHLDHTPENCADENLRCWCQRCHNRYDAKARAAGIRARRHAASASGDLFEGAARCPTS